MPLDKIFKTESVEKAQGFSCDLCKKYFDFNDQVVCSSSMNESTIPNFLHIDHEFGYDSDYDGSSVELTICDGCVADMCKKNGVPFKAGWQG